MKSTRKYGSNALFLVLFRYFFVKFFHIGIKVWKSCWGSLNDFKIWNLVISQKIKAFSICNKTNSLSIFSTLGIIQQFFKYPESSLGLREYIYVNREVISHLQSHILMKTWHSCEKSKLKCGNLFQNPRFLKIRKS